MAVVMFEVGFEVFRYAHVDHIAMVDSHAQACQTWGISEGKCVDWQATRGGFDQAGLPQQTYWESSP